MSEKTEKKQAKKTEKKPKKKDKEIRPERFGDDSLDFVEVYDKDGKRIK